MMKRIESREEGIPTTTTRPGESNGNDDPDCICCSICMEPWSSVGNHQVSCLPCGHLFGLSCIKRWIQQSRRNNSKCPKCNRKCALKDIIRLYVSGLAVANYDEELEKRLLTLEAAMEKTNRDLQRKAEEQNSIIEANIEANGRWMEAQNRTLKQMKHDLQRTIEEQNSKIEAISRKLEVNDRRIGQLMEALKANDSRIRQLTEEIERQNEQIRNLKELANHMHPAPQHP
ncbi:zinc finger protein [Macleaya cordata]|uniref:Zinc finger protein n=1 Tax=Macleaya cordata TaxID=56857 RepID=A0A200Q943_MACCD|nr:zinc finger protein [Macleaya cordata]